MNSINPVNRIEVGKHKNKISLPFLLSVIIITTILIINVIIKIQYLDFSFNGMFEKFKILKKH